MRVRPRRESQSTGPAPVEPIPPVGKKCLPQRWVVIALASGVVGGLIAMAAGTGDGALAFLGAAGLLDQIVE